MPVQPTSKPRSLSAQQPGRLDKILAELAPEFSRARLQALIAEGQVKVAGKTIASPSHKLKGGEAISLTVPEAREATPKAQKIKLDIVYEDKDLLVINKPAGMVVHPASGNADGTLVNALLAHCGKSLSGIGGVKRPGIVHRLDKDTSGLIVAAKNDAAHKGLSEQFADHTLSRTYTALAWGVPKEISGTIEGAIARSPANRKKMALVMPRGARQKFFGDDITPPEWEPKRAPSGKHAVTHYEVQENFGTLASIIICVLETGRTHQIRVHLAGLGHSVMGDATYGRAKGYRAHPALNKLTAAKRDFILNFPRQALHAAELRFIHPVSGKKMLFTCALPDDIKQLIKYLSATRN